MKPADDLTIPRIRCAPFNASLGADPVGSAGRFDGYLLVEVPLPWARDISGNEPFSSLSGLVTAAERGVSYRLMGIVPEAGEPHPGLVRVMHYRAAGKWFRSYQRSEYLFPEEQIVELCGALLEGERVAEIQEHADDVGEVIDFLLCTHGKRDACCGGSGMTLHQRLEQKWDRRHVRLWRSSHTGGHRFAPTGISLPDGHYWAYLDADVCDRIVERRGDPADLAPHCRGSSAFEGPAQAAEREVWGREGWEWLDCEKWAEICRFERDTLTTTVRVGCRRPDGSTGRYEIEVCVARWIPQPTCGEAPGPEYKVNPEWRVSSVKYEGGPA